jgi:hypothetical protein
MRILIDMPRVINRFKDAQWQRRLWTPMINSTGVQGLFVAGIGMQISTGVSDWTDAIKGVTLSQGTGSAQPTYNAQRNTFVFDGTDDLLTNGNVASYLSGNETTTIITGFRTTRAPAFNYLWTLNAPESGLAGQSIQLDTWDGTVSDITSRHGNGRTESNTVANDGKTHLVAFTYKTNYGSEVFIIDGTTKSVTSTAPSTTINWSGQHRWVVGAAYFGGAYSGWFQGDIDMICFFDGEPSTVWRQKFEGWYAWWRVAVGDYSNLSLLPASHPFRNRPPLIGD